MNLFDSNLTLGVPLADRMRPVTLDEFIGQEHILGTNKILRRVIKADILFSMILWGPPGSGKTTLARLIANYTKSHFQPFSAVVSGINDVKKAILEARERKQFNLQKTILFVDEIHHFSKSQQDAFLPPVEEGTIILIGATTENPSFEVNAPLLSRARVFHLRELSETNIIILLEKALKDRDRGFGKLNIRISKEALSHIAKLSEGDARDAYNALEIAVSVAQTQKRQKKMISISLKDAEEAMQAKFIRYDKTADGHFDAISALHKSLRSSDVDAALHYTARMLEAGEDPLYIARRLVRFAAEDIGMADPFALVLSTACQQAIHFVGMPESNDIIAETVIYLAMAPKSRSVDQAYSAARKDVQNKRLDPIPLEIRNAPTKLMKDFGFGKSYKMYDKESRLPKNLKGQKYYRP